MPQRPAKDVVHAALTDHRVPLRKGDPSRRGGLPRPAPGEMWVSFYANRLPADDPGRERDMAVSLAMRLAMIPPTAPMAEDIARNVWKPLERAAKNGPNDALAWEALARTRRVLSLDEGAKEALHHLLKLWPNNPDALHDLGQMYGVPDGLPYLRKAVEAAPKMARYRAGLARGLTAAKDWAGAEDQARAWVGLEPGISEARMALCEALAGGGKPGEAKEEFAVIRKLRPPDLRNLEARFRRLVPE
jgi:hypothetical protein